MGNIKVSVVITTKNAQKHIGDCLASIRSQIFNRSEIEIIVVDNNSNDKTKSIAYQFTDKVYNIGPERSAQRNFGISHAQGEYVLYLDVDMTLSRNVISECVSKIRTNDLAALYIPEIIVGKGFWINVRNFERSFYNATVIDCVRFIKKDIFIETKGFDENLTGPEDWDFDRRINQIGRTAIINSPIYHNEGKFNLKNYLIKKSYYSKTFEKYVLKWGKNDRIVKKQLGFSYRFLGVFVEKGKWKKLISKPALACGMYFLRFLVGVTFFIVIIGKNPLKNKGNIYE
ncbi:MAG: glycosyltransferase [Candidatus Omnitrophica bacterium]|nr:glycosyltransferase [Candidatus Omnitrophota bacterium]